MRRLLIALLFGFGVTLMVLSVGRMGPTARAVVAGVTLGIVASIPTSLLLVALLRRQRQDQHPPEAAVPPPVIIVGRSEVARYVDGGHQLPAGAWYEVVEDER